MVDRVQSHQGRGGPGESPNFLQTLHEPEINMLNFWGLLIKLILRHSLV